MQSRRETRILEVVRLRAAGLTLTSIADQLDVHKSTVGDDLATFRSTYQAGAGKLTIKSPKPVGLSTEHATTKWSQPIDCEMAWAATGNQPGLYRWYLGGTLPETFDWPDYLSPMVSGDLLYVGKASNLRTRAKHHRLPTAGSTLRRTLASLMGFQGVWRGKSAHPHIAADQNALLTDWMSHNLLMSFRSLEQNEALDSAEQRLRTDSKAPLNKDAMTAEQQHASKVGKIWNANAIRE